MEPELNGGASNYRSQLASGLRAASGRQRAKHLFARLRHPL